MAPKRPRKRQAQPATFRSVKRIVDRIDYGVKFTPGPDPPEYARAPWWSITLVATTTDSDTYTWETISGGILMAMGASALYDTAKPAKAITDPFMIRLQTVRVWGLDKQPISLNVYDLTGQSHLVKQLTDMGSAINYSRIGWRFGVNAQIDPGDSTSKSSLFTVTGHGKMLVYVQVLFCRKDAPVASIKQMDTAEPSASWFKLSI